MAQHVVLKKKDHVITLIATKVNLKRARLIASHPMDKYATYMIAEVVEIIRPTFTPKATEDENRESVQEAVD